MRAGRLPKRARDGDERAPVRLGDVAEFSVDLHRATAGFTATLVAGCVYVTIVVVEIVFAVGAARRGSKEEEVRARPRGAAPVPDVAVGPLGRAV